MVSLNALMLAAAISAGGDPVLLNFTAPWCTPCREMEPTVQRLQADGYPVRNVDVGRESQLADEFQVTSVPSFVLLVDGREVQRVHGKASYERLAGMFPDAGRQAEAAQIRGQSPDRGGLGLIDGLKNLGRSGRSSSGDMDPPADPARDYGRTDEAFGSQQQGSPQQMADARHAAPVDATPTRNFDNAPPADIQRGSSPTINRGAGDVQQAAKYATVRIKVKDSQGHSYGTGTVIDTHGDEALVVTCGHIFRDSAGKGQIMVDLFHPQAQSTVAGQLIAYDADERDIGLISIRPGIPLEPVPVAPPGIQLRVGDPVFSLGCDRGQSPTVRESRITSIDRYLGAPNIQAAGQPVDGRSGGGLFTADGYLVGICNAADPQDDEGIYAGLKSIHWQLDQIGMSELYRADRGQLAQAEAGSSGDRHPPTRAADSGQAGNSGSRAALAETRDERSAMTAMNERSGRAQQPDEVICIIQSRDDPTQRRMIVLHDPSDEFLQQLERESERGRETAGRFDPLRSRHEPSIHRPGQLSRNAPEAPATVIRGQPR